MTKWTKMLAALGIGALATLSGAQSASAAQITISSTTAQSGFAGTLGASNALTDPVAPYDFTGQQYNQLVGIDSITVTLSLNDGHTGPAEFDFNNLSLGLDGIDTGLKLNGFVSNNIVTLTLNQLTPGVSAALVAALADNQLVARIIDTDPADGNDPLNFISLPALIDTTLDLNVQVQGGGGPNPVPLPAAALLAPLGAGLAGMYSRRFRKAK